MSGLGLISDYNNDSEDVSDSEDKKGKSKQVRLWVLHFILLSI